MGGRRRSRGRAGWWLNLPSAQGSLIAGHLRGEVAPSSSHASARLWIENFPWRQGWLIAEDVTKTSPESWLVVLSAFPDPDDDPDLIDREAEEELERRRMSFRRY